MHLAAPLAERPANGAWRDRVSPSSGPRVAHRRRSGHSSQRGSRGLQTQRADVHEREQSVAAAQRRADLDHRRLGRAVASRVPRTRSTTRRMFTSTAGTSASSACARTAAAV